MRRSLPATPWKERPERLTLIPLGAREIWSALISAVVAAGDQIPCTADADRWVSDSRTVREAAAADCAGCAALTLCSRYAVVTGERWSVLGGVDRRPVQRFSGTHHPREREQQKMSEGRETDPAVVAHIGEILAAGGRVVTAERVDVADDYVEIEETYSDFDGIVSAAQFLNRRTDQ